MPKVSVIIPVYNAHKDIGYCCNSLFSQTLDDMEFIFVDDKTPDDSMEIIEQVSENYPLRKNQIKILHQTENMGVSAARQRGLNEANGDYIIHCDSDDYPDLEMYERMYNNAIAVSAEIVCCDYYVEYPHYKSLVIFPDKYINRPSFNIGPVEGAVWNKLISYRLIQRCGACFYENINLGEDFGFVTPCRLMSLKTVVLHEPMYHYRQNVGSITHNYTKDKFMQVVVLAARMEDYLYWHHLTKNYEKELCFLKFESKAFFLMFSEVRDLKLWKSIYPESNKYLWVYAYPLYIKLAAWLIGHNTTFLAQRILYLRDKMSKIKS